MIGDNIIITQKAWRDSENIINKMNDNIKNIVLIGGVSGSQKSECADCLQSRLYKQGLTSFVISLDDYYKIDSWEREQWRKCNGIEKVGLEELDWVDLNRIIEDFHRKRDFHFRRIHRYAPLTEYDKAESKKIDVLIIEGLYAGYLRKFHSNNLSVYLDGTPSQTLEFRKMRKKEDENDDFRRQVVQKEFNTIVQLKRYADLILQYEENKL